MLTKTEFLHHEECPIWLWLVKMRPDLLPEDSPVLKRRFEVGNQVDRLARKLFPDGVEVDGFDERGWEITRKLIAKNTKTIFQPTAISPDGLCAKADVLERSSDNSWNLYEVKSTTSVKGEHIADVAFQKICFENAGVQIDRTILIYLNKKYVRRGDLNLNKLFIRVDITEEVNEALGQTKLQIEEAKKVIAGSKSIDELLIQKCPDPHKCDYLSYYIHGFPEVYGIADKIPGRHLKLLLERGILDPDKLTAELLKTIGYNRPIQFQTINANGIKNELDNLVYPLYFFDYEAFQYAIPQFEDTSPYQQIPFQYSLHLKETPDSPVEHKEFLASDFAYPIPELLERLKNDIGDQGSVLVWNQTYEKTRNNEMGKQYPKYAKFLTSLNARMFDLMPIFKFKNKLYLHSDFEKSASLKKVLPVLCPDLSYDSLEIRGGEEAAASWPKLTSPDTSAVERKKLARSMLEYCGLDTLALVKILEHLMSQI